MYKSSSMRWHQSFREKFFQERQSVTLSQNQIDSSFLNLWTSIFVFCCFYCHCGYCYIIGLLAPYEPFLSWIDCKKWRNNILQSKVSIGERWARLPFQQRKLICNQNSSTLLTVGGVRDEDTKGHFIKPLSWVVTFVNQFFIL